MSAASFWKAVKAGALRQPRVCEWPGCKDKRAETGQAGRVEPERKGWKITMRNPALPHQVVIGYVPGSQHRLYVSCNCRGYRRPGAGSVTYEPLEVRGRFEPHEPIEIWRKHMAEAGAA